MGRRRGENCLSQMIKSEIDERKRTSFFTSQDLLILFSHEKNDRKRLLVVH